MTKKIRRAVFPVAGLGTRFLPATKACPKEMLPIVDKPLIQYAVEEAASSGITEMIFVTGRSKRAIEDHFDKAYELEAELGRLGKTRILQELQGMLPRSIRYSYVRQNQPLGLGHAVMCARSLVADEPFAVILPDDLLDSELPVLGEMMRLHEDSGASVIAVQDVERRNVSQYGVIRPGPSGGRVHEVLDIVEKPKASEAPSTLAVVGRYILDPMVFECLRDVENNGGEIQLTDGIRRLLVHRQALGYQFDATRYDCGSKLDFLKAQVAYGIKHPELGDAFAGYLEQHFGAGSSSAGALELERQA
jgi:UTP--glucose-1-phosphate uridylyltransferase